MALVINDRVKETSSTTGTGALTFAGAVSGFETFAAGIGNSNTTYYAAVNTATPTEWEVGLGTLAGDSSTITRTTVISSSNSDSAVDFGAGTKEIFVTLPASKAVIEDASSDVTLPNDLILGSDSTVLKFGADSDTTLTHTDGTGLTLNSTNKICFNDTSQFIQGSSNAILALGATDEIDLTATAVDLNGTLDVSGNSQFSGTITVGVDDTGLDVKFFGATSGAYMLWDESTDDLILAGAAKLYLYDAGGGENLSSDGTDLTINAGTDLNLTAGTDINIPADVGLTFGNDGEKIEGDGTDLTISGNNINLTATADVVIPANVGVTFGTGEKIEGDSTDLTVTSGADINLTATADVNIPSGVGVTFGDDGEKIEGDGTDLTIASSAKLNLTATSDVHIPNNVGIVFGGDSEKIEGDGTDMTISANNLTIDAAADIVLDADGADVIIKDDGTAIGTFTNSSSDFVIASNVNDKDILIKGEDGGSTITACTFDMSAAGKATFNNDVVAFSDERLKTEIKTIENGLDKVLKMRGVTFKRDGIPGTGVIAQEVQDILPEAVSSSQEYLAVAYGNMVGVLIEAIKDLQIQIDELKGK